MRALLVILSAFSVTALMQGPVYSVPMQGRISWKPVFEYDNSGNDGTITFRKTLSYTTSFTSKVFMREVNEASYRHAQQQQDSSTSINVGRKAFEVLGVIASRDNTTTTEFDTALRLTKEHTMETVQTTTQSTEQIYTVGPRSRLNLYQKVFSFAGLDHECDAIRTTSEPLRETEVVDVTVKTRPVAFIRDIEVVYGDYPHQVPAIRVSEISGKNGDINSGFGGDFVWLKPVYTYNVEEAASRFDLIIQGSGVPGWPDLAKGAGGQFRFLRAVNDHMSSTKITELALLRGGYVDSVSLWGFSGKTEDINGSRKGDFLYLMWKTHPVPDMVA